MGWVGFVSNCTMGLFWGCYCFVSWLLGGCVGNWIEIHPLKQSHNAFRHNTDPISTSKTADRATDLATESLWWFLKPAYNDFRVFHSVFRYNKEDEEGVFFVIF